MLIHYIIITYTSITYSDINLESKVELNHSKMFYKKIETKIYISKNLHDASALVCSTFIFRFILKNPTKNNYI